MENISEKTIELVHVNPSIYDKKDMKYKDVKYKERIWEDIGKQINLPAKECKVKWKSLRDKYRKIKNTEDLPSGSGQKIGTPWKYMASMEFLAESMEPASTTGNIFDELDTSVEYLEEDSSSQFSRSSKSRKRNKEDLFTDVLVAMKRKYEKPQSSSTNDQYENFFGMLRNKFNRLTESEVDDVQVEMLQLVNKKINTSQNSPM